VSAREPWHAAQLRGRRIGVPGMMTSASLALRLMENDFEAVVIPFDRILGAVRDGEAEAGLVIHEGQLTYADPGLRKVVDLGQWWHDATGLPLPQGGNAVHAAIGARVVAPAYAVPSPNKCIQIRPVPADL